MESIKLGSTLLINAGRGKRGLLWQPRFFDRALRSVKECYENVEYIHLDAGRAGLAKPAEEWQWSSERDYTGGLSPTFRPNRTLAMGGVLLPTDEGDKFEGKAAESLKNEALRYLRVVKWLMRDFGPTWKWIRDLAEGGQAQTFLVARADGSDDRQYVLKRLKNVKRRERFDREIQACLTLDHPNVVRIIDHGTDPKDRPFLVTEYCAGGSLAERPMPLGTVLEVLAIFRQVCAGAAYAHQKEIVHRDIKPDNIFLRDDGTTALGDFGICFVDDDGTRLTMTDEVAGSRWYCAPELRDGRLPPGIPPAAADVYSLGKVLYWMLSGGRVFDREQHREDRYRLGQHDPGAPEYELVSQLLDRMIVADPSRRIIGAQPLLLAVDGLMSVIRAGGHAITLDVPHRCLFCAQGEYKVLVNGLKPGKRLDRSYQQISDDNARSFFGWNASRPGSTWLILVCESCGHVQVFRPDLAPEAPKRWGQKA